MRRLFSLLLIFLLLPLTSCSGTPVDAYELMSEFVSLYGAEGVVYSPGIPEGSDGYITTGLVERIFLFPEGLGDNFAILLNAHIDSPSECGIFVCSDDGEVRHAEEVCLERLRTLGGDSGFVKKRGRVVYYATLSDPDRAERIFKQII